MVFYQRPADEWFRSLDKTANIVLGVKFPYFIHGLVTKLLLPKHYKDFDTFAGKYYNMTAGQELAFNGKDNWGNVTPISELHCKRAYRQHCTDVLTNCPKENLIVLDSINQTYEEFCQKLGMVVPESCKGQAWPTENKDSSLIKKQFELTRKDSIFADDLKKAVLTRVILILTVIVASIGYILYNFYDF